MSRQGGTLPRRALQVLAFPGVLFGATVVGLLLLQSGASPLLFTVVLAGSMLTIAILEHFFPCHRRWQLNHGDVGVDILHNIVSGFMTVEALRAGLLLLVAPVAAWLSATLGASLWPSSWPLAAQLVLALVVSEPLHYWTHRLAHERSDVLWSWHAVHHSAERLYWLNVGRDHPLGITLQFTCQFTPLVLMGCPAHVFHLWALFSAVHGMLQHSNVDMRLGVFHWVFSSADLHRWHHSRHLQEANHNYGAVLIYCDLLFGSFFLPARQAPSDPGISYLPTFPKAYLSQLTVPFRWAAIKEDSRGLLARQNPRSIGAVDASSKR